MVYYLTFKWYDNETITLWDIQSGQILRIFEGENEGDLCLAATADGKNYFVSPICWSKISVWDLTQSKMMYQLVNCESDKNDPTPLFNNIDTPEWMKTLWLWADKYHIRPEDFPRDEKNLLALEELCLSEDVELGIEEIPEELGMLNNLTSLGLMVFGEDVIVVPESLGDLTNLTYLRMVLYCSETIAVPKSLGNLTKLIELELGLHSKNNTIPKSLSKLTQIENLSLSGDLAQSSIDLLLKNYNSLQQLTITDNEFIRYLPDNICDSIKLRKLILRYNNNLMLSDHQFKYGTDLRTIGGDREVRYCTSTGCFDLQFGECFEYYCFIPSEE